MFPPGSEARILSIVRGIMSRPSSRSFGLRGGALVRSRGSMAGCLRARAGGFLRACVGASARRRHGCAAALPAQRVSDRIVVVHLVRLGDCMPVVEGDAEQMRT